MKKWIFVVSGCVILAGIVLINVLIPSTLTISRVEPLQCRAASVWPFLSDEAQWKSWWRDSLTRNDCRIRQLSYYLVNIGMRDGRGEIGSQLSLLPIGTQDSSLVHWEAKLTCGWDPVSRIRQYLRATRLKETMDGVLADVQVFAKKKENLYGLDIQVKFLTDTLLVGMRSVRAGLPTTEEIYAQIDKLSRYISEQHSRPIDNPMTTTSPEEGKPGTYKVLVAIPVDARLEGKGDISFMRLIPWRYLTADVKGGPGAVTKAFKRMDDFVRDYQITVLALPWQSLVTDRRQQPDSSRWVTRLYYPIF